MAYEYSFYDDGSRKETNYYKKGKLKYTWNYDCKSEGEIVQEHNVQYIESHQLVCVSHGR